MNSKSDFFSVARSLACPHDQIRNFARAGVVLQPTQLAASAAARLCDSPTGPRFIGYGGARGGGKSYWMLAQIGVDDCQRFPDLKVLLLRKVGKSNVENFEDHGRKIFRHLPHEWTPSKHTLTFDNGSRIIVGHFQHESDIDAYLGLEYDVVGIEEATTLTAAKYLNIVTCCRTSKKWRPRIYSTTNPGGVGHAWYRKEFVIPHQSKSESDTRFIPARVTDNRFLNAGYRRNLERCTGWKRRAWLDGDWDIASGQFFTTFRREVHVVDDFDETRAVEWFAALDYGFAHYTVALLGCRDGDGNIFVVDEHAARNWVPERQVNAIHGMLRRHRLALNAKEFENANALRGYHSPNGKIPKGYMPMVFPPGYVHSRPRSLARFVAGADVFSRQSDGATIASQYSALGISLRQANTDRINGWAEILQRFGDPDAGIPPRLFIHSRCARLIECIPTLQHDPNRPEDVLGVEPDEDGEGGDDSADALRYLVATKPRIIHQVNLGF